MADHKDNNPEKCPVRFRPIRLLSGKEIWRTQGLILNIVESEVIVCVTLIHSVGVVKFPVAGFPSTLLYPKTRFEFDLNWPDVGKGKISPVEEWDNITKGWTYSESVADKTVEDLHGIDFTTE